MSDLAIVVAVCAFTAGITVAIGGYGPARGQAEALKQALDSIARQPDEADRDDDDDR